MEAHHESHKHERNMNQQIQVPHCWSPEKKVAEFPPKMLDSEETLLLPIEDKVAEQKVNEAWDHPLV